MPTIFQHLLHIIEFPKALHALFVSRTSTMCSC